MPMINLKITKGESTAAQKAQVIKEMTDVLRRVMGKNPDTTIVIIDEVETDNWGIGGQTVTQRRKAEAS
jgi:4-oxalocrotonate tautomerase